MLHTLIGFIISAFALMASFVSCDMGSIAGGGSSWDDPAGDAQEKTYRLSSGEDVNIPALDIVRVDAEAEAGQILIRAKTTRPLGELFDYTDPEGKRHGVVPIEYFFDTDNSTYTGGSPFWGSNANRPLEGYDVSISVMLGYKTRNRDSGMESKGSGNILVDTSKEEVLGSYGTFMISSMGDGINRNSSKWDNEDELTSVGKDFVEIRIPYEWLDLKPGDSVRLCFQEREGTGSPDAGFSEDKILKLK